ncbi:MAG: glycosyltransferase [Alistipes sp.]
MEKFYDMVCVFWQVHGITGVAVASLVSVTFIMELCHYLGTYASVAGFRLSKRTAKRLAKEPPISVVVPLFGENYEYLDNGLTALLTQDCTDYEVVAVYVGNDDSFYADLSNMSKHYAHLKTVQIAFSSRYPVSTKMALNVGIKTAANEHIVTTTTDAMPASRHWLARMAKGFTYRDIVIGYCGMERKKGLTNRIFREWQLASSVAWLAAAIGRHPYGASRHNMGFTKTIYFGARGFNHLNMNAGEDDLFIQQVGTADNVAVVLSPNSSCFERQWGGWSWWINRMRYFGITRRFYPVRAKAMPIIELSARVLFWASAAAAIVLFPVELKIVAGALLALRFLAVELAMLRISRRLGERNIAGLHFVFDITEPIIRLITGVLLRKRTESAWR